MANPNPNKKFSILVAEDEEFQRNMLIVMLKSCDYDVVGVENGKLAMDEIRRGDKQFDLVLLDLNMPEMNGFEVLSLMQEDESLRDIQIIIMSAHESNDIISNCLKNGALNYLVKPIKKN